MGATEGVKDEEIQKKVVYRNVGRCLTFFGLFGMPCTMLAMPSWPLMPVLASGAACILVGSGIWSWASINLARLQGRIDEV